MFAELKYCLHLYIIQSNLQPSWVKRKSKMKTEIKENLSVKIKYPCLMKSKNSGAIILFQNNNNGMLVHNTSVSTEIGSNVSGAENGSFEIFNGVVTLSND